MGEVPFPNDLENATRPAVISTMITPYIVSCPYTITLVPALVDCPTTTPVNVTIPDNRDTGLNTTELRGKKFLVIF